ncbi:hypothetical protein VaNZ11_011972 [Volvox africanus]|uniref:RNA methyltransferase n=1 Tax=Volvox africanus TaxID=51714 RepID=A0ABQ5SDH1_9CHLO|nr:hypothetical protein VaNZ11_011972 [Volvox africanus]
MSEAANCGTKAGEHAMPPTDPGTLVQQLKSQLLPSDKIFSKNQRKKARKKVTKIIQKTLGICPRPGVNADGDARTDDEGTPSSQDTGCCSNHRAAVGSGEARPACTSSPQTAKFFRPHSPGASAPPCRSVMEATDAADAPAMYPPSNRRRVGSALNRSSSGAPALGQNRDRLPRATPAVARHAEKAASLGHHGRAERAASGAEGLPTCRRKDARPIARSSRLTGSGSPSIDDNRGGSSAAGGSNQLSQGALKRLSRRQARPDDLLTADNDDNDDDGKATTATAGPSHTPGCLKPGARSVIAVAAAYRSAGIAGGGEMACAAAAAGKRRDRRQSGRSLGKRARLSEDGTAVGAAASEEVIQIPPQAGTAASAAAVAAAATAVHRGYALYCSTFVTATAATSHLKGGSVARQVLVPAASMPPAGGVAAARGPLDLSAALLMMRVQLRASDTAGLGGPVPPVIGTADITSGVDASVPAVLTATADANMASGGTSTIRLSGYASDRQGLEDSGSKAALFTSCALSTGMEGRVAAAPAGVNGRLGLQKTSMQAQKQQPCKVQQQAEWQAAVRASRYRYGNYHRYYGYRMSADMDEDPRVKLMRREWFQQRVCIDVGCNEGLVTLAVAARFGAKRMTGYDIDGTLIKKACRNLRNTRTEYTTRLQAMTHGHCIRPAHETSWGNGWEEEGYGDEMPDDGDDGVGGSDPAARNPMVLTGGKVECGELEGDEGRDADADAVEEEYGSETDCADEILPDAEASADDTVNVDDENGVSGDEAAAVNRNGKDPSCGQVSPPLSLQQQKHKQQQQQHQVLASSRPRRGPHSAIGPAPVRVGMLRSYVKALAGTRFVQQDWANARGRSDSADTILCLSVTKWVHLNNGDEGLKRMFKKFFNTLTPGGLLILEPQPWKSYNRAVHKTTTNAVPYKRIEQLQLRPQHFVEYLTNQLGFVLESQLREGQGVGFDRPMYLLRKPMLVGAGPCSS